LQRRDLWKAIKQGVALALGKAGKFPIETGENPAREGLLDTPARHAKEIDDEQRKNNE
jgi:GTP cyclohydrolase I